MLVDSILLFSCDMKSHQALKHFKKMVVKVECNVARHKYFISVVNFNLFVNNSKLNLFQLNAMLRSIWLAHL